MLVRPCTIIGVTQEAWDLCVVLFVPDLPKQRLYIFIDNKSAASAAAELSINSLKDTVDIKQRVKRYGVISMSDMPNKGAQYFHTSDIMEDRDFVYIYIQTDHETSFSVDNVISMGRDDTFRFLGPIKDLYKVIRNTSS